MQRHVQRLELGDEWEGFFLGSGGFTLSPGQQLQCGLDPEARVKQHVQGLEFGV